MALNEAQYEAVHTLRGPLLVLAGAGSGKTRVVTQRIAELIRHGTAPERILAVTFTNKAAAEMRERVGKILFPGRNAPPKGTPMPEISTFHALCVQILRRNIVHLGYPEMFAIYDRGDQESLAGRVLKDYFSTVAHLRPSDFINIVSHWKTMGIRPDLATRVAENDREYLAASLYPRYQTALKACGAVDFDDILLLTEDLFEQFPEVETRERERFDHILVDEYQDTNQLQYRIIQKLAQIHRNLCVVGDDDQSIYAWRGADVTHILRFQHDWPEAKVVRLEKNYRSTHEILAWANRIVQFNRNRHPKTLQATYHGDMPRILQCQDEDEEAEKVVEEIRRRIRLKIRKPGEIAVLFRTNEQSRPFEFEFQRQNVPYTLIGGMSFFDRKETRDLLAYLRVILNPKDEVSLLRAINTPPRGIGQTTMIRCMELALRKNCSLWEILGNRDELLASAKITAKTITAIDTFRQTIDQLRKNVRKMRVDVFVRHLVETIDYRSEINRLHEKETDQQIRWNIVEDLVNSAGSFAEKEEKPYLGNFVQKLSLADRDDSGNDKEEQLQKQAVVLMTLHAAKGLEFPEVYMVGMEEGFLPHKKSLENDLADNVAEERRLCYVGVTRAKSRLTLSLALQRMKWGKKRNTIPSRFLYELTGKAESPNYQKILQGNPLSKR
ncbi:MAG: UvrD-helicase domain-containing protein [Planctomycetia bacterium]|nr:UvrD-helicase domain-containing protein [Planctomycetia bacterium]